MSRYSVSPGKGSGKKSSCHLEDSLLDRCIDAFHQTIRQDVIDQNVMAFCRALTRNEEFRLVV